MIRPRLNWIFRFALALAVTAGMDVTGVLAAGWNVKNIVRQEFRVDDNIRMITDNAEPVWGFVSTPELNASNKSPNFDFEVAVILVFNQFFGTGTKEEGAKEQDSFDQHFEGEAEYRIERHTLGFNRQQDPEYA